MGMNYWARKFDRKIPLVDALWEKGISKLVFTRLMNLDGARPQRRSDNIVSKPYGSMTFRHLFKISVALDIPIGEVAEMALKSLPQENLSSRKEQVRNTLAKALDNEEKNQLNSKGRYHANKIGPPPKSSRKWDYDVD